MKLNRLDPEIPWDVSTPVLADPKAKHSGTFRRTMMRSRGRILENLDATPARSYGEKLVASVARLNLRQLQKLVNRSTKAVRFFDRELAELPTGTMAHERVQIAIADAWNRYDAALSEAARRSKPRA